MDILQEVRDINKKSFISHVFSTTDEGKAEVLNIVQYATLGVFPIVLLNKLVQRFIPEADSDKSTLELLVEIFLQIIIMFCGMVIIHRTITLAFLIIVLSIQTKLGIKVNILTDRALEMWNGPSEQEPVKKRGSMHSTSQSDYFDNIGETIGMPPPPVVSTKSSPAPPKQEESFDFGGPQAANGVLGGSFGSFF